MQIHKGSGVTARFAAALALVCGAVGLGMPAHAKAPEYTIAIITHAAPGDTFWDIVRKGAEAAAKNDHVRLLYLASPDASKQAQLVVNAVQQHVSGIALTLAHPDAMRAAVKQAQEAHIPVVGFNAGTDQWKSMGLLGYAGQDEMVAGEAVGDRLNDEGAKNVLCVNQEQGAVQLEARCDGIKKTFHGKFAVLYVNENNMADVQSRIVAKLQQDPAIDYVVTLGAPYAVTAVRAIGMAGSKAVVGTFDMSPTAIRMIAKGTKLKWAIDQQPYVEGYEAVDMLWLNLTNGDTVGGGRPVLTGPSFVSQDNAALVAKYAERGTR